MKLSDRLLKIASFVLEGGSVVDVGCDHGYLPIYLIENKKISHAIATDVGEGPLSRARKHIREHHLEDEISLRLSDGLLGVSPGEADTLVIAGMGGHLMIRILSENTDTTKSFKRLILEPQSDAKEMRKFLYENGFHIIDEDMVQEENKFYPIIVAEVSENSEPSVVAESTAPSEQDFIYGTILMKKKNAVFMDFLNKELAVSKTVLRKLQDVDTEQALEKRNEMKEKIATILSLL